MTTTDAGVSRLQYERDVHRSLDDLTNLVQSYGLSWESDAMYEIRLIVEAHLSNCGSDHAGK
jgi:hypothetical protein